MKPWENGILKVDETGRYLRNGDKPFFWMGDTAWLIFRSLKEEEAYNYLKNRKEKGYNIILCDFIHDAEQRNVYGDAALIEGDFSKPDTDGSYWKLVDRVIEMAEQLGLYMGILPVWGSSIVKGGSLNADNVDIFMDFIIERYKDYKNLVWIVGGDVRGNVNEELFNHMGERFKKENPEWLVGYHPFGRTSSSLWFHDQEWLDFNMFQSGHRRYDQASLGQWDDNAVTEDYYGEDSWRYVARDYQKIPAKPTLDGEPSYEEILQGLHDESQPYWKACDVRRYAYWSVFAGAFGHTYGHNSIMQFYADTNKKGAFGAKSVWQEAMHQEGGGQMKHLFDLMTSVDYYKGREAGRLLITPQGEKYDYIAVFAGENYVFCYDYSGREFTVDLTEYKQQELSASWFDPVTGTYSFIREISGEASITVKPVKREDGSGDYVLVLRNTGIDE